MPKERGWLIETTWPPEPAKEYWCGGPIWSKDHLDAIRFVREADARKAAFTMLPHGMPTVFAEHQWDSGADEEFTSCEPGSRD
jgi:hypothetical protein